MLNWVGCDQPTQSPASPVERKVEIVQRKVSDVSGADGADDDFRQVVVRSHPQIDQPKALDVLEKELETLKEVGDLVILEIQQPGHADRVAYIKLADFGKWCPDEALKNARGTRGRLPGSRNGG